MPQQRTVSRKLPPGLKLRGSMYTMDFQHKGKSHVKSTGLKATQDNALQLAKELLADYRYEVRTGKHLPKVRASITLKQVLEQWEAAQSSTAWKTHKRAVQLLCQFFDGSLHPNEAITPLRVANYAKWRMRQKTRMAHGTVTWQTCKEEFRILRAALTCAEEENQIDHIKIKRPRIQAAPRGQTAGKRHHPAKLESFLARCKPNVRAFLTFCRWTGARQGEALRVEPQHIRPSTDGPCDHEVVLIQRKGHVVRKRVIPLNRMALEAARYGMTLNGKTVFPWPNISQYINQNNRRVGGFAKGEYITARDMRHLIATELFEECGNLAQVMQFLGHTKLVTTEKYLHPDTPQLGAATSSWLASKETN